MLIQSLITSAAWTLVTSFGSSAPQTSDTSTQSQTEAAGEALGEAPKGGHSLWISMHGGGGAPAEVNDQQWNHQIRLYEPVEGYYVAPRAPTNSWNMWHQGHVDDLFDRMIQAFVACRGVNPNRVYLLGYSAGGDGVYQLAPRMSDRFAAAAMMAGHPNETKPDGLRNLPFTLFMDGEDRVALPWMARRTRDTWPSRVVWLQDDVVHPRNYWLEVDPAGAKAGQRMVATVDGQTIEIVTDPNAAHPVTELTLHLIDRLIDIDRPITVRWNGSEVFAGKVMRSRDAVEHSLATSLTGEQCGTATLKVTVDS